MARSSAILTHPDDHTLLSPALLAELVHLDGRERFAVLLRALIEHSVPKQISPQDAAYFLAVAAQDVLETESSDDRVSTVA